MLCALSAGLAFGFPGLPAMALAATQTSIAPATASAPATDAGSDIPNIPTVLGALDASRYAAIFSLQEEGNWKAADAQIEQLKDKTLLGELQAQRYVDSRYKTSFDEARVWLEQYADLPEARAVWTLARKRAPGKSVPSPMPASAQVATPIDPAVNAAAEAAQVPLPVEPPLINLEPPARYEAGLSAWRARKWTEAAADFEAVARGSQTASWYAAAGAFWAARAHLMLKEPQKVDAWFAVAAEQPRTFYGMLARRTLGLSQDARFDRQPLSKTEGAQLQALPGGRRALALVQVGETDRAEAELRALSTRGNKTLASAIVALADLANMPALCLALTRQTRDDPRHVDSLYPVPPWQPRNGFSVDRALLFALMMQESRFDAEAQSGSGAAGLMQLMPGTAKAVARRAGIPLRNVAELVDPVLNLSLGQEYVKQLIEHEQINGNLILVLAAYNSGTAPLAKWQSQPEYQGDPLLFIEALPRETTRLYVERVLTNMWIYRQRLGQEAPDLDALAANKWPTYVSMNTAARAPENAPVKSVAALPTQGSTQHAEAR
jgi:soluble lytic murein transglycosylase